MNFTEHKLSFPVPSGAAPALAFEPRGRPAKGTMLLYHGLGARKEAQRQELGRLAEAGFRGICIDALHHGERNDGFLDLLASDPDSHTGFIQIVRGTAMEVPRIVDTCLARFEGRIGIAGISLGGFVAYAAVPADRRIQVSIPILGSPEWAPGGETPSDQLRLLMEQAPARFPQRFPPCALLAANAGKDITVLTDASRSFIERLKVEYKSFPERLRYLEFPESEHMMREQDWKLLWDEIIHWLDRFLAP